MALNATHIMTLSVQCDQPIEVGHNGIGTLVVIPIIGGTVSGQIEADIVPGGADWSTRYSNDLVHVFAKYMIKTHTGHYIAIENSGIMQVSHQKAEIKTTPKFTTDINGPYGFLNAGIYVGSLSAGDLEDWVTINIYQLQ